MRQKLRLGPVDHPDRPLEQRLGQGIADMFLLARPGFEEEGGDARITTASLIGIVARWPHALNLHWAVPFRRCGDRAAIGAEADQSSFVVEAIMRELPDIVLAAHLAHLGELGIADMGVMCPDNGL